MYCKPSCFIILGRLWPIDGHVPFTVRCVRAVYIYIYRNARGYVELTTCNGSFARCALSSSALSSWTEEGSGALKPTGCSGTLWWKCFTWWDTHLGKKKKNHHERKTLNAPSVDEFQRDVVQSLSHLFRALTIALVTKATITSDPIAPSSGLLPQWLWTGWAFKKWQMLLEVCLYI